MRPLELKDLLNAGVHFGHQVHRWNPRMKPFVYREKGGIHIINLKKSIILLERALDKVRVTAAQGGRMIFVGTKKQAVETVQRAAKKCQQFYVTKRWLGGTLTNFLTIKSSIDRLKKIDQRREKGNLDYLSKKERAKVEKEYQQMKDYLEGIQEMKDNPDLLFVVDLVKEHIAVAEAQKLGIPVIGIADTNSNPERIDFPIPGNDDSVRSIDLFSNRVAEAFLEGAAERQKKLIMEGGGTEQEEKEKIDAKEDSEELESQKKDLDLDHGGAGGSGHRKLVAAGMAEDVEIEMELETEKEEGVQEEKQAEEKEEPEDKK